MIIMISAANADVCLSMARILKSHDNYKHARLVGLSPGDPWPAKFYFDEILSIPMANDPGYQAALVDIINTVKPDFFVPFSEAELAWFSENPEILKKLNTKVIINSSDVLDVCLDKVKTAEFLKKSGVHVPETCHPSEVKKLPVIVKPRRSAGSKNMAIIRNEEQLQGFLQENASRLDMYTAQELIDVEDAEFTCALLKVGGEMRSCTLRRTLQGGMTGFAKVEKYVAIDRTLEVIADSFKGDLFINVQLRVCDGVAYVFEINPRFSSTVMMRHKVGFEDFIWTLDYYAKHKSPATWQAPVGTMIFRVSDECVVKGDAA